MKRVFISTLMSLLLFSSYATAQDEKNKLTHGAVQMTLKVGETSQFEIIETFGAPNITTMDGKGREVWVYRRHAVVRSSKNKSGGISIGFLGPVGGGGGAGGAGFNASSNKVESSYRAMTLVIKFDEGKIVSDFRSRSSSF